MIFLVRPLITPEALIEDPLRILRAIRFAFVLDFKMSDRLIEALTQPEIQVLLRGVDSDRIRKELTKMFAHNTVRAMKFLVKMEEFLDFPTLCEDLFPKSGIKLLPVTKEIKTPR